MKNFLTNAARRVCLSLERSSRERVRNELLRLDPRLLNDAGLSRTLLHEGVGSWPWRLTDETEVLQAARHQKATIKAQKQAIKELQSLSDHELSDLAITRGDIEYVVRNGRRDIDNTEVAYAHAA